MRIISMEKGDNIKGIFTRFANATVAIKKVLVANGNDFMHNEHLGFILTCPSNCGTGLRAGAITALPLLSARPSFKADLKEMGLQARGTAGVDSESTGGKFDISNSDRLGFPETKLCNFFIEGLAQLIKWEQALEKEGANIDDEVKAYLAAGDVEKGEKFQNIYKKALAVRGFKDQARAAKKAGDDAKATELEEKAKKVDAEL